MTKNSRTQNKQVYFGNLPSNYLPNLGKSLLTGKCESSPITYDDHGNCEINKKKVEANACSLIDD